MAMCVLVALSLSGAHAETTLQMVCVVRDTGRLRCASIREIEAMLNNATRFAVLIRRLNDTRNSLIKGADALFACSNGDVNAINLSTNIGQESFPTVAVRDYATMRARCQASLLLDLGVTSSTLGSLGSAGYGSAYSMFTNLVGKQTDIMLSACNTSRGGLSPYLSKGDPLLVRGGMEMGLLKMAKILWDAVNLKSDDEYNDQQRREAIKRQDREEEKAAELSQELLEKEMKKEEAERKRKAEEEERRRQQQKKAQGTSTTAEPKPRPADDDVVPGCPAGETCAVANCIDEACAPSCKEAQEAWFDFKNQCSANQWKSYTCVSYLQASSKCADPALILPTPDGVHSCARTVDAKTLASIRKSICAKTQGISNPGPDGNVTCPDPNRRPIASKQPGDICNDPHATPAPDQCPRAPARVGAASKPKPKPLPTGVGGRLDQLNAILDRGYVNISPGR